MDLKAAMGPLNAITSPNVVDDRKGVFTTTLSAITEFLSGALQNKLNDTAIMTLYGTLPHLPVRDPNNSTFGAAHPKPPMRHLLRCCPTV